MAPRGGRGEPGGQGTQDAGVPTVAAGTPYTHPDQHSWMLQSIGEMRESIGGLKHAVEMLTKQTEVNATKLSTIGEQVHTAKVTVMVVGSILSILSAIVGALIIRMWGPLMAIVAKVAQASIK